MLEYYNLFSQYISLAAIILGGVKIALLSFFIALVILIIFRKKVLIRRSYPVLKYLARSYYFLIPLLCLCFGFVYGIITATRDDIVVKLPTYQASIQKLIDTHVDFELDLKIDGNVTLDQIVNKSIADSQQQLLASLDSIDEKDRVAQQIVVYIMSSSFGVNYVKDSVKGQVSMYTGFDESLTDEIFEAKLSEIFTGEMLLKIAESQLKRLTNMAITPLVILWLVLLLIPLIEIILAVRYNTRYEQLNRNENNSEVIN